ncbi:cell division FtsK/SpoIIIE (plasmid) [Clostridium botulinum C/D str. BKT12695]|nr:cell division FtsK/SpoIIIE [Clostridium botulinum C/D str. BKT12695]
MITEFTITAAGMYLYERVLKRVLYKIRKEINNIFYKNNLEYNIINVEENQFGYTVIVSLNGIGYDKLDNLKDNIETCLSYNTYITQNDNLKTATIDIITERLSDTTKFSPVTTKPYEFYCGLNLKFEHLKSDLTRFPHVLVSGQTSSGKTEIIRLCITNLIHNFSDRDINIYFSDLSDMCDYEIFKNCKQVKGYAKTIEESEQLFEHLMHIYKKRLSIFSSKSCKNIKEYNKSFNSKRMSYIYLVLDEFADYFPQNQYEDDYKSKVKCYNILKHMVRKFRKSGIFLVIGIQRPDTTVLDPSLRSNLCTKIGFSQNTNSSSLVVCDTDELTNIENRKGLFMYGNTREWFKSLYIDDKLIKYYIKNSVVTDKKDFNKFLENNKKINSHAPIENIKPAAVPKLKTKSKIKICI